jgi:hypothetical protein
MRFSRLAAKAPAPNLISVVEIRLRLPLKVAPLRFSIGSLNAVIRVYDGAGNVIETHEHVGDFRQW